MSLLLLLLGCVHDGAAPKNAATADLPRWTVTMQWEKRILLGTIVDDQEALKATLEKALAAGVPCAVPPQEEGAVLWLLVGPDGRILEDEVKKKDWVKTPWDACLLAYLTPMSFPPAQGAAQWRAKVPVALTH